MALATRLTAWTRRVRPTGALKRQDRAADPAQTTTPPWMDAYTSFMDGELQRLEASLKDLVAAVQDIDARTRR